MTSGSIGMKLKRGVPLRAGRIGEAVESRFASSWLTRTLAVLLFVFAVFPYVNPIPTPFDTQPFALVIGCLLVIHALLSLGVDGFRMPLSIVPFMFVALVATLHFLAGTSDVGALRSLAGYISAVVIALAAYYSFPRVKPALFFWSVGVWFAVGLGQLLISRSFGVFLLARSSTSDNRGITGLAVEPSYYATICIFFLLLNDVFRARNLYGRKAYVTVLAAVLIQMIFAASAMGYIMLGIYALCRVVSERKFAASIRVIFVVAPLTLATLWVILSVPSLSEGRLGRVLQAVVSDPWGLVSRDVSVASRLFDLLIFPWGLTGNSGLGFGLNSWNSVGPGLIQKSSTFVQDVAFTAGSAQTGETGGRLMSGWGTAVFELGIFGAAMTVAFVILVARSYARARPSERRMVLSVGMTVALIMLFAIPLAFPLFGYSMGVLMLSGENETAGWDERDRVARPPSRM